MNILPSRAVLNIKKDKIPTTYVKESTMITIEEQFEKHPVCPFCSTQIDKLFTSEIRSFLGRRYIYYCSKCLKVLGKIKETHIVSHI
jgi:uncharacterized protein with PIN domain